MDPDIDQHIAAVRAAHAGLASEPRLVGGARLLGQFEDAVTAYRRHGRAQVRGVIERVNELAVARLLLDGPTLAGSIIDYEPEVVPGGSRFDFRIRAAGPEGHPLYAEVKTVMPNAADTEENWDKAERRAKLFQKKTWLSVAREWMGATIAANSFNARSKFMSHARDTEKKLAEHRNLGPADGFVIICGDGFAWDVSELEDFADFYATGKHRPDDPYARMEAADIADRGIALARTLNGFAAVIRSQEDVKPKRVVFPVQGATFPANMVEHG